MCKKKQFKYCPSRLDECMINLVEHMQEIYGAQTVACCCGHKKYHITLLIKSYGNIYDLFSGVEIPRKKKFYKKDKKGYYFIPEVEGYWKGL